MTFEQRKYRLIQEIILVNQVELIDAIDETIENFTKREEKINLANHTNISKTVDLSEIKKERPLIDLDMEQFATEANDLEWNKSVKELLSELD